MAIFFLDSGIIEGVQDHTRRYLLKSKMVTLLFLFFITLSSSVKSHAFELGKIQREELYKMGQQRVHELVEYSQKTRKNIQTGRDIAGKTEEEIFWIEKFEKLMNDTSDTDYLQKALEL